MFSIIFDVLGIYFCFLVNGIILEGLYKIKHPETNTTFNYPILQVTLSLFGSFITAKFLAKYNKYESLYIKDLLKTLSFIKNSGLNKQKLITELCTKQHLCFEGILPSLTSLFSMICTNSAINLLPYPLILLVKSAKCIPVLIGGTFIFKHKYSITDYINSFLMTISLILYQLPKIFRKNQSSGSVLGYFLLIISLLCDCITGPKQDQLTKKYNINYIDMMFITSIPAILIGSLLSLILESPFGIIKIFQFGPTFLLLIFGLITTSSLGSVFIIRVLTSLGSLHLTLITTTRKFIAILLSLIFYKNKLTFLQYFSIFLMFMSGLTKPIFKLIAKKKIKQA